MSSSDSVTEFRDLEMRFQFQVLGQEMFPELVMFQKLDMLLPLKTLDSLEIQLLLRLKTLDSVVLQREVKIRIQLKKDFELEMLIEMEHSSVESFL